MYLAYFDESGDSGLVNSQTTFFVLACVLIQDSRWLETLDRLIKGRRMLKNRYGVPVRAEIKATHFRRGVGALERSHWAHLSPEDRYRWFGRLMRWQAKKLNIETFAIAIHKAKAAALGKESRETAWMYAIQRLNTFAGDSEFMMTFPDEGHGFMIRRLMRKMRRFHRVPSFFQTGTLEFKTTRLVEDPNDRLSHHSLFIQLADWNAYAAHRSQYVDPRKADSAGLWDDLAPIHLRKVNRLRGGPPGMVIWPK
jgi:hypothetical protein